MWFETQPLWSDDGEIIVVMFMWAVYVVWDTATVEEEEDDDADDDGGKSVM